MENCLLKTEFYFAIIIYDYKPFFSANKSKAYLFENSFLFFFKNKFFAWEWCYVKQKKENNKKQKGEVWYYKNLIRAARI
jgi:hypothetical protein